MVDDRVTDKNCFIHVPKTGGSAVVTALQAAVGAARMYQVPSARTGQVPLELLLSRYSIVSGHFTMAQVSQTVLESAFTFTFLRDPVDRVISLFFFYKMYPDTPLDDPRIAVAKSVEFSEFVAGLDDRMSPWSNWQTYVFSGAADGEAPARELLPAAIHNLDRLSFVGVQDDLAAGVHRLSELRGWAVSPPVERLHATRHRPQLQEVPEAIVRRLTELNQCDRALFAHATQRWNEHRGAGARSTVALASDHGRADAHREGTSTGTKEIVITSVVVQPSEGTIIVRGHSQIAADDVTVGIRIADEIGVEIYGTNTRLLGLRFSVGADQHFEVTFRMHMPLAHGTYYVTTAIHGSDDHLQRNYHWLENAATFVCPPPRAQRFSGLVDLKATASVHSQVR